MQYTSDLLIEMFIAGFNLSEFSSGVVSVLMAALFSDTENTEEKKSSHSGVLCPTKTQQNYRYRTKLTTRRKMEPLCKFLGSVYQSFSVCLLVERRGNTQNSW